MTKSGPSHIFRLATIPSMLLFTMTSISATAAPQADLDMNSMIALSLEQLLEVTVTSVSKREQALGDTSAAVHVISADDIRRSGATNVPEALRLAPGVQVAAMGHNRWTVGIRGFNSRFSNKLLVLVDGRAIYNPLYSGVFWEHNDLQLANIERIEVIRGPGASIWGANAVNGVINIITASAADTQGGLLSVGAGDEMRGNGLVRYGWALDDDTHVRLHASSKSVDGGRVAGGDGHDEWDSRELGFRLDALRGTDRYHLQGAVNDFMAPDNILAFDVVFPYTTQQLTKGDGEAAHLLGRWERQTGTGNQSIQAYYDYNDNDLGIARYRTRTLDFEYQKQISTTSHNLVWGLGYRHTEDRADGSMSVYFTDRDKSFDLYSAFIQDEITLVPDRWLLTLGSRFEYNDFTGFEVQPTARLMWTPTDNDSLWTAVSRAVRTLSRIETSAITILLPPLPPELPLPLATVPDPQMGAEELIGLDLGWRRQWLPNLNTELAAFYYRYNELRGVKLNPMPQFLKGNPYLAVLLVNDPGADASGLEASVDWLPLRAWRLQAQLSLYDISERGAPGPLGSPEFLGTTPSHLVSLRSSLDITSSLQWDVWLRYAGVLEGIAFSTDKVPAYTTLDMRLAWKLDNSLDLSLVGQNLLDSSHLEFVSAPILSTPVEIERAFYLKLDWRF